MSRDDAWRAITQLLTRVETLGSVMNLLHWDEATMMPPAGSALRGRQQALLSELSHEWVTHAEIPAWVEALEGTDDPVQQAAARNLKWRHEREVRVPAELVAELSRAKSEGFSAWLAAKQSSDFATFRGPLQTLVDLVRRRAEAIDPSRHPYEVTLEEFDRGVTVESLRATFSRLRDGLTPLLGAIRERPQVARLDASYDRAAQVELHREVAGALGYDLKAGRVDLSEHPFTCGQGDGDVRITTYAFDGDLLQGLGAAIHETGHALYEQGLPRERIGTTVAEAASYGLHESQSRFWENFIGRSAPFCGWLADRIAARFPDAPVAADELFRASNRVAPSLIRVEADEVTYNLHVIVRFEIELALFEGAVEVVDLPALWGDKMEAYLGVRPPTDALGVLQDVHWSGGSFGYFPSYTLGNLYAASLGAALEAEMPTLWDDVGAGRFGGILEWLRERVHRRGHLDEAPAIIRGAVGERDAVEDFLSYLWNRHGALYGVSRGA